MTHLTLLSRTALSALMFTTVATVVAAPAPASAQGVLASEPVMRRTIHVPRDKSLSFRLPGPASKIVIAQPEIAKVTATGDASFYVQGMEFGAAHDKPLLTDRGGPIAGK